MKNGKVFLGDPHKAKRKWEKKKQEQKFLDDAKNGKLKIANAVTFWDNEYTEKKDEDGEMVSGDKFSLSTEPSEDLQKFTRWLDRQYPGQNPINPKTKFVDAGCGNGRNSFFLAENFGAKGVAYDISPEAIKNANKKLKEISVENKNLDISFSVQNLSETIPVESDTQDFVIDAVASHVLKKQERVFFKSEVLRVLTSGSYYFLKSLLLDDDSHAKKMIKNFGKFAGEENSYIHPSMGIFEHIPTEKELIEFYSEDFEIDKVERSFAHRINGKANKRRYIVMYLRKK
jgi:ubiquinone/menaquinone biosynthesis C-methylase UbiE